MTFQAESPAVLLPGWMCTAPVQQGGSRGAPGVQLQTLSFHGTLGASCIPHIPASGTKVQKTHRLSPKQVPPPIPKAGMYQEGGEGHPWALVVSRSSASSGLRAPELYDLALELGLMSELALLHTGGPSRCPFQTR